jgi:hypothetical protein
MADKLIAVLSCLPNTIYDTTPMPLNYQPLPLVQVALLSMASQHVILVDNLTAWGLSFLPNTTYDLPACD